MALNFDREVFQQAPMGVFGNKLVGTPPPTGGIAGGMQAGGMLKPLQASMQSGGMQSAGGGTAPGSLKGPGGLLGALGSKPGVLGGLAGGPAGSGGTMTAGGMVGAKGNPLGPKQIAAMGGAPAAAAGGGKAQGGKGSKKPAGPLTGDKLIDSTLEGVLRGEKTSFGPDVINNMVSGALQSREAANRTGLDDVNRQLASRGLGRSAVGAGMAGDVLRGNRQDYSSNISDIYSEKAKSDFADKMGGVAPYMQQLQMKNAKAMSAANLAEQKRQFDINQANRGKGGGGDPNAGQDDMLFKLLMGGGDTFGF